MSRLDKMIAHLPEEFRGKPRINVLLSAFADELDELDAVWQQLKELRTLDAAQGKQLEKAGDIVVLSRAEAAKYMGDIEYSSIDDEKYRLFLKYKALRNATNCTYEELMNGCRLLFDADPIYYTESEEHPATFNLSVGANLDEDLMKLLENADLTLRSSGVQVRIKVFDKKFFGFSDTNRYALGFGVGKFAQEV